MSWNSITHKIKVNFSVTTHLIIALYESEDKIKKQFIVKIVKKIFKSSTFPHIFSPLFWMVSAIFSYTYLSL